MRTALLIVWFLACILLACGAGPSGQRLFGQHCRTARAVTESGDPTITNLVAWWKLDDNAASTVVLDSKGSYNGTSDVNTSTISTQGVVGTALLFDGSKSIGVSTTPWVGDEWTVTTWINRFAQNGGFDSWFGNQGYLAVIIHIHFQGDYLRGGLFNGNNLLSATAFSGTNFNRWIHCTLTFKKNDKLILYVNGVWDAEITTGADTINAPGMKIGLEYNSERYFKGAMDDFRVYSRVLTTNEISRIWNNGAGRSTE